MTGEAKAGGHRRRDRALGATGQVAGVIGIVLCVVLAVAALLGRGWANDTVDSLSQRVDQGISRAIPPLTTAATLVGAVSTRIGDVATAADAVAAQPVPQNEVLANLQSRLQALSARYLELRATYADVREQIATAIERLQAIDRLVPGLAIPQGPIEKLQELDGKIQEVDAAIMDVIGADLASGAVDTVAGRIADRARQAQASLGGVSDRITGVSTDLVALQAEVASTAATAKTAITLGTIVAIVLLAYLALLHWILFRVSRRLWATSGPARPEASKAVAARSVPVPIPAAPAPAPTPAPVPATAPVASPSPDADDATEPVTPVDPA